MNKFKSGDTHQAPASVNVADDREVNRIVADIMVEYRATLTALAKSEAEDREITNRPPRNE